MDELKRAVKAYLAAVDRERSVTISLNQALLRGDRSTLAFSLELNRVRQEILEREGYLRTVLEVTKP
jgi:hypothetical protein